MDTNTTSTQMSSWTGSFSDDTVVGARSVHHQGRDPERLFERAASHVDMLNPDKRHHRVGVEQPSAHSAEQAPVDGIAEPLVDSVRGDEDAAERDQADSRRQKAGERRVEQDGPVDHQGNQE